MESIERPSHHLLRALRSIVALRFLLKSGFGAGTALHPLQASLSRDREVARLGMGERETQRSAAAPTQRWSDKGRWARAYPLMYSGLSKRELRTPTDKSFRRSNSWSTMESRRESLEVDSGEQALRAKMAVGPISNQRRSERSQVTDTRSSSSSLRVGAAPSRAEGYAVRPSMLAGVARYGQSTLRWPALEQPAPRRLPKVPPIVDGANMREGTRTNRRYFQEPLRVLAAQGKAWSFGSETNRSAALSDIDGTGSRAGRGRSGERDALAAGSFRGGDLVGVAGAKRGVALEPVVRKRVSPMPASYRRDPRRRTGGAASPAFLVVNHAPTVVINQATEGQDIQGRVMAILSRSGYELAEILCREDTRRARTTF